MSSKPLNTVPCRTQVRFRGWISLRPSEMKNRCQLHPYHVGHQSSGSSGLWTGDAPLKERSGYCNTSCRWHLLLTSILYRDFSPGWGTPTGLFLATKRWIYRATREKRNHQKILSTRLGTEIPLPVTKEGKRIWIYPKNRPVIFFDYGNL